MSGDYLTKTYSTITGASSCMCTKIVGCLPYNWEKSGFQKKLCLLGKGRWKGAHHFYIYTYTYGWLNQYTFDILDFKGDMWICSSYLNVKILNIIILWSNLFDVGYMKQSILDEESCTTKIA